MIRTAGKLLRMPKNFVPVARPHLGQEEVSAAGRAILSGWVTQGPEVAAFEGEFAAFVDTPHACAVSSGTTALHLALLAVGVRPDDEVITVSHSYIATANSIRYCGAMPVFVDIEPETFNIDPRKIEPAISKRTRAILCVHQIGMPCDLKIATLVASNGPLRSITPVCKAGIVLHGAPVLASFCPMAAWSWAVTPIKA